MMPSEASPLRVLFVSHSFPPENRFLENIGGMQRVATELYEALSRQPELKVSGQLLRSSWKQTGLRTPPFLLHTLRILPRRVHEEGISIILFSSMVTALLAPLLKKRLPATPLTAIIHGQDVTYPLSLYQRYLPRVFHALDAVFPVSRATAQQALQRGTAEEKVHVIPNGIDLQRIPFCAERTACRRVLFKRFPEAARMFPEDGFLLCSVGRQVKRKGFHWFIQEVMPLLPEHVHYWLAGEGPMHENLRRLVERMNLSHRVHLLGRVTEEALRDLYRGANLFVMPNIPVSGDMEGFGVVMLEAGLAGLPVVASRLEGIIDVIEEGKNGHLVPPLQPEAFWQAILPYVEDTYRLEQFSRRASTYVRTHFSWDAIARQYVHRLTRLAAGTRMT